MRKNSYKLKKSYRIMENYIQKHHIQKTVDKKDVYIIYRKTKDKKL